RKATGMIMKRAENRKNGTTPSHVVVKRRPGRAGSAPRAVGADGATLTVVESAIGPCRDRKDHLLGGGVLSGPSPVTDAHEPLISVLAVVSWSSVGNTVPVTSGSLAFKLPEMTFFVTRSV